MESHIDRILNGDLGYGRMSLYFPDKKLELTAYENENAEGFFDVRSDNDRTINGSVYTSDPRMVCDSVSLEAGNAKVHYVFRGLGLEAGNVIKGDISFVCEGGEYRLPFSVSMIMKYPDSSQGVIKNLFHFTNLARKSFKEAVEIFYSREMINVFSGADKRYRNLYKAFAVYPGSEINVEEFLIAVHKKSPVIFTTEADSISLQNNEDIEGTKIFRIRKSGWGYLRVNISSKGDFLKLETTNLTERDFTGDTAAISYTLDREALHPGNNSGMIIIKSFNSKIKIPLSVDITSSSGMDRKKSALKRQKAVSELISSYLEFRLKKTDLARYCDKTDNICAGMIEENDRDVLPRLVKTHVLLLERREREAALMLSLIGNELMLGSVSLEDECYYKYLNAALKRERSYTRERAGEVASALSGHPDSPFLLSILFNLDEELGHDPVRRLEMLEHQFSLGVRSPFLYIEILAAMTDSTGLKGRNSLSEMYALNWGAKNGIFYESLISSLLSISYGYKGYSAVLLNVLKAYYEKFGSPEILESVITLLIRERGSRKRGNDDFRWFEEGVKKGLKITRLYESYLNSLPEDYEGRLPEEIVMYFSIGAGVGDERMAFLYANLIRNKDSEEIAEVLRSSEQRIAGFAIKEAENGRLSENLAVIYEYVASLNIKELQNRFMLAVSPLLFRHEVSVEDSRVRMVIAFENGFENEHRGIVTGGKAMIDLYGGDYELILEYSDMRRGIARRGVSDRPLLNPARFIKAIRYGLQKQVGQAFYVCGSGRHGIQINQVNEQSARILASSSEIERHLRDECIFALIRYYSDNDRYDDLDRVIDEISISEVSKEVRAEIARLYVARGMLGDVYSLIRTYGPEGVDPGILVRLASRMIAEGINTEDPCLMDISFDALKRGKYDEHILKYLSDEYNGTIKELRDIWKCARSFGIDTVKIEERILSQMLFSRSFTADRDDILLSCITNGGRDKIIDACLTMISHEYFVYENIVDEKIFNEIGRRFKSDGELSDISALALLKHTSEREDGEESFEALAPLARKLIGKGMVFDFFRRYRRYVPEMDLYHDRTFVEYRTAPGRRVMIHYCIYDGNTEDSDYTDKNMDEMYQGVYVSNFVLFYGEKLQYFITEESGDERNITESHAVERDITTGGRSEGRYDLLNDMLLSESVSDDPSLETLMEQYMRLSETVEEMF